jgi:prepilin peptidase CpaA
MLMYVLYITVLLTAATYDGLKYEIPNFLCIALAALFIVPAAMNAASVDVLRHIAAGAIVFLTGWILFSLNLLGGGDVKLLAATSLWMGLDLLVFHVFYIALLGLVLLAVVLPARRLASLLRARSRSGTVRSLPAVLLPDQGIPYGIAIAASGILLSPDLPPPLWAF